MRKNRKLLTMSHMHPIGDLTEARKRVFCHHTAQIGAFSPPETPHRSENPSHGSPFPWDGCGETSHASARTPPSRRLFIAERRTATRVRINTLPHSAQPVSFPCARPPCRNGSSTAQRRFTGINRFHFFFGNLDVRTFFTKLRAKHEGKRDWSKKTFSHPAGRRPFLPAFTPDGWLRPTGCTPTVNT